MAKGIIYILSNRAMPDYFKIGECEESNLKTRLRSLYSTGVPLPFECEYAKIVNNYKEVEKALHRAFSVDRINDNREFFSTTPDRIVAVLELLDGKVITDMVTNSIAESTTPADRLAQTRTRRSNLNFMELGIPVGGLITFVSPDSDDERQISAKVIDAHKVECEGESYSLTALTKKLLQFKGPLRPTGYWSYNGRSLLDMYEDANRIAAEE